MTGRDGRTVPATEYFPVVGPKRDRLRKLWLELPAHPALLDPIGVSADEGLELRYAALMWWQAELSVKALATIGAQLADLYRSCLAACPEAELGRLLLPFAMIDLVGYVRIGFKPFDGWNDKMAPEVKATWPRCGEQALVYAVGELVSDHYARLGDRALPAVFERCRETRPKKRYATLE
ncbi:MAG TPA: hypothetical protein VGO00_27255, partial [Kofleriaceae bacterium]|nr:hypothetical protein [Kofleriaceae bacterium]